MPNITFFFVCVIHARPTPSRMPTTHARRLKHIYHKVPTTNITKAHSQPRTHILHKSTTFSTPSTTNPDDKHHHTSPHHNLCPHNHLEIQPHHNRMPIHTPPNPHHNHDPNGINGTQGSYHKATRSSTSHYMGSDPPFGRDHWGSFVSSPPPPRPPPPRITSP